MRRRWLLAGVVLVVALTGLGVGVAWRDGERACGAAVTSYAAGDSPSPLDGSAPPPLVEALARDADLLGSRGYDYEQEVQLSAYDAGLGVRLRDSNRFTLLGLDGAGDLVPRWSVAVGTAASAFDADEETYLVVTLPEDDAPELVALDLADGERRWCRSLETDPATEVATLLLDDGSVVALLDGTRLLRADASGRESEQQVAAGRGDHLGLLDDDRVLVGGSPLPDLLDPAALEGLAGGVRLQARGLDGRAAWSLEEPAGTDVHVVGTTGSRVLLTRASADDAQPTLVALDHEGREVWATTPAAGTAFDATVRGDRVVVRAGSTWTAYDAADGARLWRFAVPGERQLLPYGAVLDAMPSLDADTLLVPATDALLRLDLRTGRRRATPLPTDGVATTYWPYRAVAPPGLLAVATNTGAVVVRR